MERKKAKFRLLEITNPTLQDKPYWVIERKTWIGWTSYWEDYVWFGRDSGGDSWGHTYYNKAEALKAFKYLTSDERRIEKILQTV